MDHLCKSEIVKVWVLILEGHQPSVLIGFLHWEAHCNHISYNCSLGYVEIKSFRPPLDTHTKNGHRNKHFVLQKIILRNRWNRNCKTENVTEHKTKERKKKKILGSKSKHRKKCVGGKGTRENGIKTHIHGLSYQIQVKIFF